MSNLISEINSLRGFLNSFIIGRESEIEVLILALVSKEHAILVSEPGTGKSMIIKLLAQMFSVPYFEYQIHERTTLAELFGIPNIKLMREQGILKFNTTGKLPEARLAFLDEIFKSSSSLRNALLKLLNEREFFDGTKIIKTPLWSCLSASNEVPKNIRDAFWDRIVLRIFSEPLPMEKWKLYLKKYWDIHQPSFQKKIPKYDFATIENLHSILYAVDISPIWDKLVEIYAKVKRENIWFSNRRMGRAQKIIASSSLLDNRMTASFEDLFVLKYILPNNSKEVDIVVKILEDLILPDAKIKREVLEIKKQVENIEITVDNIRDTLALFGRIEQKLRDLAMNNTLTPKTQELINETLEIIKTKKEEFAEKFIKGDL